MSQDSLACRSTLSLSGRAYNYFSLHAAAQGLGDLTRLPYSLKILLGPVTGVGAALIYGISELKPRTEDALLSGAAGSKLAASFYSLLQPGLEYGLQNYGDRVIAVTVVIAGMLLGGCLPATLPRLA